MVLSPPFRFKHLILRFAASSQGSKYWLRCLLRFDAAGYSGDFARRDRNNSTKELIPFEFLLGLLVPRIGVRSISSGGHRLNSSYMLWLVDNGTLTGLQSSPWDTTQFGVRSRDHACQRVNAESPGLTRRLPCAAGPTVNWSQIRFFGRCESQGCGRWLFNRLRSTTCLRNAYESK